MNKLNTLLLIAVFICFTGLGYNYGKIQGLNFVENNTRSNIASRYLKIIGNPATQKEQCQFDYVIYNDSTECK